MLFKKNKMPNKTFLSPILLKILSNIFLRRLKREEEEIDGDTKYVSTVSGANTMFHDIDPDSVGKTTVKDELQLIRNQTQYGYRFRREDSSRIKSSLKPLEFLTSLKLNNIDLESVDNDDMKPESVKESRAEEVLQLVKNQTQYGYRFRQTDGSFSRLNSINAQESLVTLKPNQTFKTAAYSGFKNTDVNGTLLLLDVLVRKFTKEIYTPLLEQGMSKVEANANALRITEAIENFLKLSVDSHIFKDIDFFEAYLKISKALMSGKEYKLSDIFYNLLQNDPGRLAKMTSRKKLQVPWLLAPAWKNFPMHKGLNHHRIPVGIILSANDEMECVLESKSLDHVRVRLLNNNRKTEGTFTVKSYHPGRASTFSVGSVSVPFVDCEYLQNAPGDNRSISVSYPAGSKILPIYRFGDKEEDFFELWDTQNAEFAYIESDYIGLLIPVVDKEAARKLPDGKHLDDVILFYDKIFSIYSELIGLSFEETGLNQNVRNRFFLKADKSGSGGAFYSDWCTAASYGTVEGYWLDIKPTNWGALHEIGHGHELKNINDETLSVNEVWNNILAFFYQKIMLGKDLSTKSSKMKSLSIAEVLKSGKPVTSWIHFHKCSFLSHMFFKAGQKSFARFNQRTREEYAGCTYYASGTFFVEKLMHFFAIDFAVDVYPFMKLAKAAVRKDQLEEHYYVLSSVAYPLNYIISDTKEINNLLNKLSLEFETSLVNPLDLCSTNLKNVFTVKIDKQIFENLSGDTLKLMDGSRIIAEEKILNETIILKDVPIGVYKIFIEPNAKNSKLIFDDFYAIVHADIPGELTLSAKIKKVPSLLPDKIRFLGLGDEEFASLSVDPFKKVVHFKSFSKEAHSYYKNEKYASVTIKSQENKEMFSKIINGDSPALGSFDIPLEGELQIEVFHAEPKNRLKMENPKMNGIIDRTNKTNYFIVNEKGLQKKNTPKDVLEKNFLSKIEYEATRIKRKISLYDRPFCLPKYNLLLAIESFECLFRENGEDKSLREQYKDCLPPPVDLNKQ